MGLEGDAVSNSLLMVVLLLYAGGVGLGHFDAWQRKEKGGLFTRSGRKRKGKRGRVAQVKGRNKNDKVETE
jgi:hypothetical protein